jgi:cation diffusion facilitator CzcD-associated flavoprotein CzcO
MLHSLSPIPATVVQANEASIKGIENGAILKRYGEERDKRLRGRAGSEYVAIDLPKTSSIELIARPTDAISDHVTAAVIGGGFAGLVAAARLKEADVGSVRLIDKGGDVGGVWYWNQYPGAQSDTSSMVYLPMLEETGHVPSEKYVHAPEIHNYCQKLARKYDLYANALFETEVTSLRWNDVKAQWNIYTNKGDAFTAQFIIFALGQFHIPRLPTISGLKRFSGRILHTAAWDYGYTGGDPTGAPLIGLSDKRVGLVGTGATAVQLLPHLSRSAKRLFVFQRTPSAVDARCNAPIDVTWFSEVAKPGWQRRWLENFAECRDPTGNSPDLVNDGWTAISLGLRNRLRMVPRGDWTPARINEIQQDVDLANMSRIRERVAQIVRDPETAECLKAWYFQFCKRPCFHDDYLQAFNAKNTALVDTKGKGVELITPRGIVVAGREHALDCIVFATGFSSNPTKLFGDRIEVIGREGKTLAKEWSGGMRSFHGIHVHGFPNAFHIQPTQGANLLSNITHNLVDAATTVSSIVRHARTVGASKVEAKRVAQDSWIDLLLGGTRRLASEACTPGNFNNDGHPEDTVFRLNVGYPMGPAAFFRYIEDWRSDGRFDGLEFS